MNSSDLFYVRYLQLNTTGKNNPKLLQLFFIEKELYKFYTQTDERLLAKIKLRWLLDEIRKRNNQTPIFINFDFTDELVSELKTLINIYDQILDQNVNRSMINLFKDFNSSYQNLINIQKINFQTTYLFQMIFFIYSNKVEINSNLKNFLYKDYENQKQTNINRLENVFLNLFFSGTSKKKITKSRYLFYIIKSYF